MLACSTFILQDGLTKCHYHTSSSSNKDNDYDILGSKKDYRVTGTPFREFETIYRHPDHINYSDNDDRTARNPNFTLRRVLEFFPKKGSEYYLHCGCSLSDVLMDFYCWKTIHLQSLSQKVQELYDRPMKPRLRLYLCTIMNHFLVPHASLFHVDESGRRISEIGRLEAHIKVLQDEVTFLKDEERRKREALAAEGKSRVQGAKALWVDVDGQGNLPEGELLKMEDDLFGVSDDASKK